ncbi:hypothetical protein JOF56_003725 [Kibdelosporangium banguiense]|uniref:Uncharacterized protein n=1 Tax=Kibdelosporangium banguiense TaxID=1365924 RepID=A0ABS4TFZ6_9PSEU|nr:hypothetical protein [Kibdelosporangium banguiense]MBP2323340.1 hypothetical protein [Kibdelosporangium banguiense]
MARKSVSELTSEAVAILKKYLKNPRTEHLRELAPVIVELRSNFNLEDGRVDWSGRSPGYREAIADVYKKARVPQDDLDRLQTALRYHVGNLIRERVPKQELTSVGLTSVKPKERIQNTRDAFQAMKEAASPRDDIPRLAAYAQALLEYVDETCIPDLKPEEVEASLLAMEAVQTRSAELLVRLKDAKNGHGITRRNTRGRRSQIHGV